MIVCDLVADQVARFDLYAGRLFNAGGGLRHSASLLRVDAACEKVTGNRIAIAPEAGEPPRRHSHLSHRPPPPDGGDRVGAASRCADCRGAISVPGFAARKPPSVRFWEDRSLDGVIVVDKPEGWTSHDVVGKMRRIANTKKIGHLGTLDPIATGVLPLVIGRATRLAQFYTRSDEDLRRRDSLRVVHRHVRPGGRADQRGGRIHGRTADTRSGAGAASAASFCKRRRRSRQKRWTAGAPTNWRGRLSPSSWSLFRCRFTSCRCSKSATPRRGCASTVRAGLTCGRSRTISGRRSAAERTYRNCGALQAASSSWSKRARLRNSNRLPADERLIDALVPASKMLPGFPSGFCGRPDGDADSQWTEFPGLAIPLAAGVAAGKGGDTRRRTGRRSAKPCCLTCIIRSWSCRRASPRKAPRTRLRSEIVEVRYPLLPLR